MRKFLKAVGHLAAAALEPLAVVNGVPGMTPATVKAQLAVLRDGDEGRRPDNNPTA